MVMNTYQTYLYRKKEKRSHGNMDSYYLALHDQLWATVDKTTL